MKNKSYYSKEKKDNLSKQIKLASCIVCFSVTILVILFAYIHVFLPYPSDEAAVIAEFDITPIEKEQILKKDSNEKDFNEKISEEKDEIDLELDDGSGTFTSVINSGEVAGNLLSEWLNPNEIQAFISATNPVFSLQKLRAGQPYTVTKDEKGFILFEYEIDSDNKLIVSRSSDNQFSASIEPIKYDIVLSSVSSEITSNLFKAMTVANETPALAVRLAEIFAWEINFIRDVKEGDFFKLLVEKKYKDGEFKFYGKILAAEYVSKDSKHEAYLFTDSFGKDEYYAEDGSSLKRAFLKAPLSFTAISSRFSLHRFHPILKTWKAHPAVDYAAPTGTPVKAIGDATVVYVGVGKGAGNYIALKHSQEYETMYLHLSGFAKGLKKGMRVRQGQIIGYVGSTGYATGPHLDFRMKKSGSFIDPEKALSPRAEPIIGAKMALFKKNKDEYRGYLDGRKSLSEYVRKDPLS